MDRRVLQDASWLRVDELWEGLCLMARLVGNVAGCGNTVDKYRSVVNLVNPARAV